MIYNIPHARRLYVVGTTKPYSVVMNGSGLGDIIQAGIRGISRLFGPSVNNALKSAGQNVLNIGKKVVQKQIENLPETAANLAGNAVASLIQGQTPKDVVQKTGLDLVEQAKREVVQPILKQAQTEKKRVKRKAIKRVKKLSRNISNDSANVLSSLIAGSGMKGAGMVVL